MEVLSSSDHDDTSPKESRKRKYSADSEKEDEDEGIQPTKKTANNVIEKRYQTNLNDKFAVLRDSVPSLRVASRSGRGEDTTENREELHSCGPAVEQENLGMMQKLEIRGLSNNYELDIKPTTSKHQRQHIGEAERISELWRDRNHIDEAMHDLRKLEGRLQGWNKHQMVAVTSTG
ncbi:hypothetical protein FOVSG1_006479 [Fusarium oxysporum f. sp. vasinfectum]